MTRAQEPESLGQTPQVGKSGSASSPQVGVILGRYNGRIDIPSQ